MSENFWNRTLDVMQLFVLLVAAVVLRKLGDEKLAATALGVAGGVAMTGGAKLGAIAQKAAPILVVGALGALMLSSCSATQIAAEKQFVSDAHAATVACGAKTYSDVKQAIHEGAGGIIDDVIAAVGDAACIDAAIRAERSAHGGQLPAHEQVRADWLIKIARLIGVGPSAELLPFAFPSSRDASSTATLPCVGRVFVGEVLHFPAGDIVATSALALEINEGAKPLPWVRVSIDLDAASEDLSAVIAALNGPGLSGAPGQARLVFAEAKLNARRLSGVASDGNRCDGEQEERQEADRQRRVCTFFLTRHEYFPQGDRYQKRRAVRGETLTAPGIL